MISLTEQLVRYKTLIYGEKDEKLFKNTEKFIKFEIWLKSLRISKLEFNVILKTQT